MMKKIKEQIKKLTAKYNPHNIALGFSIGVFFGVLPTFGTAFFWAFLVAGFLRVSKLAAILGTFVSNPFTAPFFYGLGFFVGSLIAGVSYNPDLFLSSIKTLSFGTTFFKIILGNIIVAAFFAILAYILIYSATHKYLNKNKQQ